LMNNLFVVHISYNAFLTSKELPKCACSGPCLGLSKLS
jgi:hypothetical protein